MSDSVAARREGGLLVAMRALQQLLQLGPEQIGDTDYRGLAPVYFDSSTRLSKRPRHDVMRTLWYDARVRFYVDPQSGFVSLVEIFGDSGHDPIEVYLDEYHEVRSGAATAMFPNRLRLQYGQEPMLLIRLDEFHMHSATVDPESGVLQIRVQPTPPSAGDDAAVQANNSTSAQPRENR